MPDECMCPHCGKVCKKKGIYAHIWRMHGDGINFDPNAGYKNDRIAWNKGLTKETDIRVKRRGEVLSNKYKEGLIDTSYKRDDKYRANLSNKAKANGLGGYRDGAGISIKFKVKDSYGNDVCLQSSYEKTCMEILNNLKILWTRPKALTYKIPEEDKERNYFADFYLNEYNIYLDPKNDYKIIKDEIKIKAVNERHGNRVFVLTKDNLNKEYIIKLINQIK